jgi:hypothetical protein
MQTLGVSDSSPKSESRLKSLLWPSIRSGSDLDYLGIQGYWVCTAVAIMTLIVALFSLGASPNPMVALIVFCTSTLFCLFFYVGGIGVREGSRFAAAIVFIVYTVDVIVTLSTSAPTAGMVLRLAFTLVLLSNLRATWIGARWVPGMDEATLPPRRNQTFGDKFVDQWPQWIWPKIRIPYYVFSFFISLLTISSLLVSFFRRA